MKTAIDMRFAEKIKSLEERFGGGMDLNAALFVIGLQELGKTPERLSKDQKMDVIHIAVCSLLEPYGYYEFDGLDKDGWPHYNRIQKLPKLGAEEQEKLMKEAVVTYLDKAGV